MRLFIAIEFSDELKTYFKQLQQCLPKEIIHASYPKDHHLTLKFLGEVKDAKPIIEQLEKVKINVITIETTSIGFFPDEKDPRVIWLGIKENNELMQLQKDITDGLPTYKEEKQFHPHITLARVKSIKDKNLFAEKIKQMQLETKTQSISSFSLIKSTLTQDGPVYETLKEFKNT